jgi:DNA polymerase-4
MGPTFVEALSVGKFHGIGPAISAKMNALGIFTGMDMRNQTLEFMNANFGKAGAYSIGFRAASTSVPSEPTGSGSRSAPRTRFRPISPNSTPCAELEPLIDKVWRHCEGTGNRGRTVTLKVKFADFEIITRSRSVSLPIANRSDLARLAIGLLENATPLPKAVRLLGVSLSSLQGEDDTEAQLDFRI